MKEDNNVYTVTEFQNKQYEKDSVITFTPSYESLYNLNFSYNKNSDIVTLNYSGFTVKGKTIEEAIKKIVEKLRNQALMIEKSIIDNKATL